MLTVFAALEANLLNAGLSKIMKIAQMITWEWVIALQIDFLLDANICKCMIMRIAEYKIMMIKVTANM